MAINGLGAPLSGLSANQLRQNVTANNVANVNTPAFQPATARSADAAYINSVGQGTNAAANTYAPQRPAAQAQMARPAQSQPAQAVRPAAAVPPAQTAQPMEAAAQQTPAAAPIGAPAQPSNVDMITETANRMGAQNAYNINIPVTKTMNGMSQTLMDVSA